jgi:transcriptional regulator with XRE-family HTH domain
MAADRDLAGRFGENLARGRARAGLSQEELGFRASLHRTEIGMLERGVRLPRIDTVVKLAGALEVEPGVLFDGLSWHAGHMQEGSFSVSSPITRENERGGRQTT